MTVYVDSAIHSWKGKKWCHLFADTEDELHNFAARLGLRRAWFQPWPQHGLPHYDITANKRKQALSIGAIADDKQTKLVEFVRAYRRQGKILRESGGR